MAASAFIAAALFLLSDPAAPGSITPVGQTPPAIVQVVDTPQSAGTVRLVMAGDIMLDCQPGEAIARGIDPFAPFADLFGPADLVIGNLECVIATRGEAVRKPWTFRAHPRVAALLARHFDAVSLANNHTGDFGDEAFVEQLDLLRERKVGLFGGGRDSTDARRPWIVEKNGLRIAFLGYNEFKPRSFEAGEADPGVAWAIDDHVLADIRAAREVHHAQLVIPFLHWGHEYEPAPSDRQIQFAQAMIDAGATAVIGSHPHVTQGAAVYRDRPVIYSLGNFVFDGFDEPEAKIGWCARLTLDAQGVRDWDTVTHRIDPQGLPLPDWSTAGPSGRGGSSEIKTSWPAPHSSSPPVPVNTSPVTKSPDSSGKT